MKIFNVNLSTEHGWSWAPVTTNSTRKGHSKCIHYHPTKLVKRTYLGFFLLFYHGKSWSILVLFGLIMMVIVPPLWGKTVLNQKERGAFVKYQKKPKCVRLANFVAWKWLPKVQRETKMIKTYQSCLLAIFLLHKSQALLVVIRWDAWHEICQARATHITRGRRPRVIWVARAWQIFIYSLTLSEHIITPL